MEINLLLGETRILATDLVYDAGKSLNNAIDVGQVKRWNSPIYNCTLVINAFFFNFFQIVHSTTRKFNFFVVLDVLS